MENALKEVLKTEMQIDKIFHGSCKSMEYFWKNNCKLNGMPFF